MANIQFATQVLRFLIYDREALFYMGYMAEGYFTSPQHKVMFNVLKQYFDEYKELPKYLDTLREYMEAGVKNSDQKALVKDLLKDLKQVYEDDEYDRGMIRSSLLDFATRAQLKQHVAEVAAALDDKSKLDVHRLANSMAKAAELGETALLMTGTKKDNFVLAGVDNMVSPFNEVIKGPWEALNDYRPYGGNHIGEHYLLVSGAKSYKTMAMLNLAVGYMKRGYNVYYVDTENTDTQIVSRARQALAGLSTDLLYTDEGRDILIEKRKYIQGDIYADYYATGSDFQAVRVRLEVLKRAYGFVPNVILYDDLGGFTFKDEGRFKNKAWKTDGVLIQLAQGLAKEQSAISWSVAQITKEANRRKDTFDETDLADSYEKVRQSHGAVALLHGEYEMQNNLVRVQLLFQRMGKPSQKLKPFFLRVDAERQVMRELTELEQEMLPLFEQPEQPKKKPR